MNNRNAVIRIFKNGIPNNEPFDESMIDLDGGFTWIDGDKSTN